MVTAEQLAPRTRVLLAEDEAVTRRLLERSLARFGYVVTSVGDGDEAWRVLNAPDAPALALVDWGLPGLDGLEICRRLRERQGATYTYAMLISARAGKDDLLEGFASGADDFLTKPVHMGELQARLRAGERIVEVERTLASRLEALEATAARLHDLKGPLPICMHCKRIRDESRQWERLESFFGAHLGIAFSHALCPDCLDSHYPDKR